MAQTEPPPSEPTSPAELLAQWSSAQLRGQGRLSFFGMLIYEARLWVQPGWSEERFAQMAAALELRYARDLSGARIAERSLKEMEGLASFRSDQGQRWLAQMKALFPDVKEGDRILGVLVPGEAVRFYLNGKPLGDIEDGQFAELFFGIWLSPKTSEPDLRRALIGAP